MCGWNARRTRALLDPNNEPRHRSASPTSTTTPRASAQRIDYKNGVSTFYSYDPLTFRLTHLLTRRSARPLPRRRPAAAPSPAGRAARCRTCTTPTTRPATSPTSRTTRSRPSTSEPARRAEQRLHLRRPLPADPGHRPRAPGADRRRARSPLAQRRAAWVGCGSGRHPGDGNAMGTYIERYVYDAVGNFLQMQHRGSDPAHPGWTRATPTTNQPDRSGQPR
jgi:hypothetical protein